jgi:hypothetical protein
VAEVAEALVGVSCVGGGAVVVGVVFLGFGVLVVVDRWVAPDVVLCPGTEDGQDGDGRHHDDRRGDGPTEPAWPVVHARHRFVAAAP